MNKSKIILGALLAGALAVTSFAAGSLISINVDPSIKILVNGEEFRPKDVNGNDVMVFTYNGTTYAPLRALAESYGLEVGYDAERKMATVGEYNAPDQEQTSQPVYGDNIFTKSGNEDSIVHTVRVENPSYLHFTSSSGGNKSIKAYYGDGEYDYDLLVNEIGNYDGNTYLLANRTYDFEISCEGSWDIEGCERGTTNTDTCAGAGDFVTDIFQPNDKYFTITHNGDGNFAVKQWYGTGKYDYDLLVNEIGDYSGTVRIAYSDYPCFFEITADGAWSITPES